MGHEATTIIFEFIINDNSVYYVYCTALNHQKRCRKSFALFLYDFHSNISTGNKTYFYEHYKI